jgi:SSS family solute:Na+ symporter
VFKEVLIWMTVIVVIGAILYQIGGDFSAAFAKAKPNYVTLPGNLVPGYMTLVLGSAFALYLYPHAVNGVLSAESAHKLRVSTSLLPLYGVGLAFLALLGVLVYSVPSAMTFLSQFPAASQGIYVVPSLIITLLPGWLAGLCLLGIFVGGLVPAAIMAIAQANLLARNIVKEYRPSTSDIGEARRSKWASVVFKFVALGFVFAVPSTYAIQLQLLGGVLILQLFPELFLGLYTRWFKSGALILGLVVGILSGIFMALLANNYGPLTTSLYASPFGSLYIAVIALAINIAISVVLSAVMPGKRGVMVPPNRT